MKVGITGDFHFGFGEDAGPQAQNALAELAKGCQLIICAGDLFDSRIPRQETLDEAINAFGKASESLGKAEFFELRDGKELPLAGFPPIVAIHGTHERRSRGLVNPVQLLDSAKVFANAHGRAICTRTGGELVCVQGMGGVPEEYARQAMKKMDFKPIPGATNIFVFHQSLEEAIPYGGESLSASDLPEGFDLYIDGHIHWASELKEDNKRIVLAGSTVVTQMRKKEAQPKVVAVFDTEEKKIEFRQVQTRPFVFQEIEFEKPVAPSEAVKAAEIAIAAIATKDYGQKPQVKIKLSGKLSAGFSARDVDLAPLHSEYSEKMDLYIDRDLESEDFSKKADAIKDAREESKGVRELTLGLLGEALKKRGIEMEPQKLEELFDSLSEGDLEKAAEKL